MRAIQHRHIWYSNASNIIWQGRGIAEWHCESESRNISLQIVHLVIMAVTHLIRQEEKSTKMNFSGPETDRWSGGLPREGVVAEKFVPSLESLSSLGWKGGNLAWKGGAWHVREFCRTSRTPGGVQKVCAKKFVRIFRSLHMYT